MVPTSAGIFYVAGEVWPARLGWRGVTGERRPGDRAGSDPARVASAGDCSVRGPDRLRQVADGPVPVAGACRRTPGSTAHLQRAALKATIDASTAEIVVAGTPIDFARAVVDDGPVVRARYAYADAGEVTLLDLVREFLIARGIARERA